MVNQLQKPLKLCAINDLLVVNYGAENWCTLAIDLKHT